MADQVTNMLGEITNDAAALPPDWAQLTDEGLQPSSSPLGVASSPSTQSQYGLDAQRAVVGPPSVCMPEEGSDAARWYQILEEPGRARSMSLTLNGDALSRSPRPMPLVPQ